MHLFDNQKNTKIWTQIEAKLSKVFRKASDECFKTGFLDETQKKRFFVSGKNDTRLQNADNSLVKNKFFN